MIKRKLSKKLLEKENYQRWNLFIDILAMEREEDLTNIQKNAKRAFLYDSEIQNGGHLQYFENTFLDDYSEIINSIEIFGAINHAKLLKKAVEIYFNKKRTKIENVENFIAEYQNEEYQNLDNEYYAIEPDMNYYLNKYLEKYQDEFIEIL